MLRETPNGGKPISHHEEFWEKVLYFREHLDELPPPKVKKTLVKKELTSCV
jgi:hypothetical protein